MWGHLENWARKLQGTSLRRTSCTLFPAIVLLHCIGSLYPICFHDPTYCHYDKLCWFDLAELDINLATQNSNVLIFLVPDRLVQKHMDLFCFSPGSQHNHSPLEPDAQGLIQISFWQFKKQLCRYTSFKNDIDGHISQNSNQNSYL